MEPNNSTWRLHRLLLASLLVLVWVSPPAPINAQDYQIPQAQRGWKVLMGSKFEMVALPTETAPDLPRWVAHGPGSPGQGAIYSSLSEAFLEERMKEVLKEAVRVVNDYLPNDFDHDFEFWIFGEIPYAAKTLDSHLLLSARLLQSEDRERLPLVLAHEIHHLALIKAGWPGSGLSPRDSLLAGMLMEGTATWLSVESRLFPELDQILHDPQQLKASFDRVGQALEKATSDTPDKGIDLFQQDKWGYYVGCWMIQQIEGKFGREAWLELLQIGLEDATQEMIRLYLLTDPPPEYLF